MSSSGGRDHPGDLFIAFQVNARKGSRMSRNFYLRKLAEAVAGSANFASIITTDAVALGLTPAQATAFGVTNTTLQTCWAASSTPDTRTPVAVEATRVALKNMRAAA